MLYNYNEETVYQELYRQGIQALSEAGIAEAQLEARLLLEWCCKTDRNTLLVHGDRRVSSDEYERYRECIARRESRVPLQHITGEQEFMGLVFGVNPHVLVPRQDTEILVEEVMRYLHDGMRILDMCTGSGCILLSLLHYSNGCTGVGVDISMEALQTAKENISRILGMEMGESEKCQWAGPDRRVMLQQGDLFENLDEEERFDIIVSNPPYIRTDVIQTLLPEVKDYEPHIALDGKEDGLFFYRRIIAQAGGYLTGGGMLFFEIGYDQGEDVCRLMNDAGYAEVKVIQDYAGLDRVVCGEYRADTR